jgi:hypothetical protein
MTSLENLSIGNTQIAQSNTRKHVCPKRFRASDTSDYTGARQQSDQCCAIRREETREIEESGEGERGIKTKKNQGQGDFGHSREWFEQQLALKRYEDALIKGENRLADHYRRAINNAVYAAFESDVKKKGERPKSVRIRRSLFDDDIAGENDEEEEIEIEHGEGV